VCVVLLDIVSPGNHLGEIRLGGVRRETALYLQAETVRELPLGTPGNDPPTHPGPRIVGALEAEPPPSCHAMKSRKLFPLRCTVSPPVLVKKSRASLNPSSSKS